MPLAKWVAKIAKRITIDVNDKNILPDIKKALAALRPGHTQIVLNLHGAKNASLLLKNTVELDSNTAKDLTALGTKVTIE